MRSVGHSRGLTQPGERQVLREERISGDHLTRADMVLSYGERMGAKCRICYILGITTILGSEGCAVVVVANWSDRD